MDVAKNKRASFTKYWLPVIIYAIFIFSISSVPGQDIPSLFAYQDVLAHIIEYAILGLLIARALKASSPHMGLRKRLVWTVLLALGYALTDEFHQSFVPARFPSWCDVGYDTIGVLAAGILYR